MNFELPEEFRMLRELVEHFVDDHLLPLEPRVLQRETAGEGIHIITQERNALDDHSQKLGLWGLDAPEDVRDGDQWLINGRKIPMLGGNTTYELEFDNCRIASDAMLGKEGQGFAPMQLRLSTWRLEMSTWCIGIAQRALDMLLEYAPQARYL